jgi:uncharacterized protein YkwD
MLRVWLAVCLSLPLTACSMGHISMPFALPSAVTASKTAATSADEDWQGMRGLGGPGSAPAAKQRPESAGTPAQSSASTPSAVDLINELRHAKGLPPLTVSAELTQAAQMQAANLARSGTLSHIGPDGSTPLDRVRRSGYKPRMAAENIAGGQPTAVDAVRSWRESEGHLRNLLLPDATQMGIAQINDPRSVLRTYWTLVVGAPL